MSCIAVSGSTEKVGVVVASLPAIVGAALLHLTANKR